MKTQDLSDKIMDYAFEVAIISFPGMVPPDQSAKEAYKQLAGELMLKPAKKMKRVLPHRPKYGSRSSKEKV